MCQELSRSLDQEFRGSDIWNGRYGHEESSTPMTRVLMCEVFFKKEINEQALV
jgi:hypothetical protein